MNHQAKRNRFDRGTSQLNRIYLRDGGICQICNKPVSRDEASRDHIKDFALCTPEEAKSDTNVQLAHRVCNERKHFLAKSKIRVINPTRRHLTFTLGDMFPFLKELITDEENYNDSNSPSLS